MARIDIAHVPYRGGGASTNDLLGGRITAIFVSPSSVGGYLKAGRLNQALTKLLTLPEMREQLLERGMEPMPGTSGALARYIEREHASWGRVIREARIAPE